MIILNGSLGSISRKTSGEAPGKHGDGDSAAFRGRSRRLRGPLQDDEKEKLVRLNVDVIVTHATVNVLAAKQATSVIPIVFASVADPVANNVVESLARPGGNVTGLSAQISDVGGKRLELLREIVPGLRRLAIMANVDNPSAVLETREVERAARALGLETAISELRQADDVASAISALKDRADALYVQPDPSFTTNRALINASALRARLPTMHGTREHVDAGGLISYGTNLTHMFRRAGDLVDKAARDQTGRYPGRAAD
jgi:ABC-type uncharacterized transport system substrate-binding protein